MKKTVIIGATTNTSRYAYFAAEMLSRYKHEFVPIGIKKGKILGLSILNIFERPKVQDVDTITLYIGPQHQRQWYEYILSLRPNRIIFNPGTENPEFERKAKEAGVEALEACTLVMLRTGQF